MKASHNTFSYLKANIFWEIISPWWRCQNLSAKEQNVDLIDIRVNANKDGELRLCHGAIKFGETQYSLKDLIDYCWQEVGRQKKYRLLFANKTLSFEDAVKMFEYLPEDYKEFCHSCIYQPYWKTIYNDKNSPKIVEHNKHMWYQNKSFWYNIAHFLFPTIKSYAKKHNSENYVEDKINMYDYVQY